MIVSCFSLTIYLFSIGRTMGVNFLQPDTRRCGEQVGQVMCHCLQLRWVLSNCFLILLFKFPLLKQECFLTTDLSGI